MLRAGPFSDERVIAFVNRRFVPFYFDLSNRGAAGDAAAREFVVAMQLLPFAVASNQEWYTQPIRLRKGRVHFHETTR